MVIEDFFFLIFVLLMRGFKNAPAQGGSTSVTGRVLTSHHYEIVENVRIRLLTLTRWQRLPFC